MPIRKPKAGRWICYKMQSKEIVDCHIELWNIFLEKIF